MELFVTLYYSQKNVISDAAGVLDLPGDINSLFVLITMLIFHAYKKNFATIFLKNDFRHERWEPDKD